MNNTRTDTTSVYRYKITETGVWNRDHGFTGARKGDPYERIEFRGYYQTKPSWTPWRSAGRTVKVELQKLGISETLPFDLKWRTISTKILSDEETEDGEE